MKEGKGLGWFELVIATASAMAILIVTAFALFPTKESVATETALREKNRDTEYGYLKEKIEAVNGKLDKVLEKLK